MAPRDRAARPGAAHIALGRRGENAAAAEYVRLGCRVLARNWRPQDMDGQSRGQLHGLELDLVCESVEGELIFVEVKTRADGGGRRGEPCEWLSPAKLGRLARAVTAYLAESGLWERPCRVDLAAVTAGEDPTTPTLVERFEHVLQLDQSDANPCGRSRRSVDGRHADWQPW